MDRHSDSPGLGHRSQGADARPDRTRLAPSPTGALHLGNASSFLLCWALAKQRGWEVVVRVEDLDGPRIKPGSVEQSLETLAWLGLDWTGEVLVQSADTTPYVEAMQRLAANGLVYPCDLSRAEIAAAASAPQEGTDETVCPPTLRPAEMPSSFDDPGVGWRFATPEAEVAFDDRVLGTQRVRPAQSVGDFVVWTRGGEPSYQLACVVDDARQGVTHAVRGSDLVDSAGRQLLLYRALGLEPEPTYWHLPLVIGPDGRRLAKRHGDTRVLSYRDKGVRAERIIALLGRYHGMGLSERLSAEDFARRLDHTILSREPIVFTQEDHRWLLDGTG